MSQPVIVLASGPPPPDPYGGAMASEFNWCHRLLFPRFFRKVRVDGTPPACLQELATRGTLIYVTPFIGQLELQFFNHMALSHRLPLARFVNDLRNIWWRPWRNRRGYRRTKSLPHPVRSGYLAGLLRDHHSVLLRLRTSRGYDDLFWDDPAEDPLVPLIHLQRTSASPLYMVPMQFFWERRPSARRKGLIDLLFGERDHPGWLRRFVRFWRHYAAGATAHIGEPIALADFLQGHLTQDDTSAARVLRQRLLGQIHQEKLIATGPPLKPRRWIIEQISETEGVQRVVYSSARETGKSVEDFKQLARQYADEIAADIRYGYIELAERVLRWVFRNIYDGIAVDEAGFAAVKRAMAAGPTIFVPSHRSHVDGMILSYLLFQHRLATPHLAAGINMAFWPAGPFFRRCGAFFLRRTFGKNPLYRAVFAEYITLLLREQYSVEFFIEGGRSRTGKSLKPRMGILCAPAWRQIAPSYRSQSRTTR
ncbi:MAG: 1-acyl-sn-glycerol-3-phosphate acyltransferase [Deltaproteobacteria bacterium]|nr:1-acyl-sn-glycerol-3-phosphate acyltransferase [Deltaproteobacteria bacterium]